MAKKIKFFISLALVLIAMGSMGCNSGSNNENKLSENPDSVKAMIESFNTALPITFDSGNELDSIYYDMVGNEAVFSMVIDDAGLINVDSVLLGGEPARKLLTSELMSNEKALAMYQDLARGGVGARTVMMGKRGRSSCQVEMTPAQVLAIKAASGGNKASATRETTSRDSLDQLIDSINALCPDTVNNKITMTKAQVENNYLVYNYVVEEGGNGATVDRMKGEMKGWKASADSKLRKPAPELLTLMKLCINNSLGMKHRYVGKSTKQAIDYSFSAVDLSKMCNHPLPEDYVEITERIKEPKPQAQPASNNGVTKRVEGIY